MFAIVDINGYQYKVPGESESFVPRMKEVGSKVTFDNVLMFSPDNKTLKSDSEIIKKVEATVLDHLKDDTVIVFKKKKKRL